MRCANLGGLQLLLRLAAAIALSAVVPWKQGALANPNDTEIATIATEVSTDRCEPIVDVVFCTDVGYKNCSLPNIRGHETQEEAQRELADFEILIKDGCSNALVHLLCAVYAPFCRGAFKLPPCRNLCEYVRSTCAPRLAEFDIEWPPHLQCEQYPPFGDLCFGLEDPSVLQIPEQFGVLPTTSPIPSPSPTTSSPSPTTPTEGWFHFFSQFHAVLSN